VLRRTTTSLAACLAFATGCQAVGVNPTGSLATHPESSGGSIANVPAYRGDSAHSGQMPGPGPSSEPLVAWQYATGGPLHSSAVVRGETVYVVSGDGVVHALGLTDGAVR
jgi:hypothetical protein